MHGLMHMSVHTCHAWPNAHVGGAQQVRQNALLGAAPSDAMTLLASSPVASASGTVLLLASTSVFSVVADSNAGSRGFSTGVP